MKNYKAVIFDLDGVIVSTDQYHYQAWKSLSEREHIDFDETINHRLRGVSRRESLIIILEKSTKTYTEDQIQEMMYFKNELYRDFLHHLTHDDLLEGVAEVLLFLRENGIKIAIGSSSKNTKMILSQIGLDQTFDTVVDGTMIEKSKPDPEVFLKAAHNLGLDPRDCIVVEDAIAGIEAAKAAKMFAFAVGDATKSDLADIKATSVLQLIDLF